MLLRIRRGRGVMHTSTCASRPTRSADRRRRRDRCHRRYPAAALALPASKHHRCSRRSSFIRSPARRSIPAWACSTTERLAFAPILTAALRRVAHDENDAVERYTWAPPLAVWPKGVVYWHRSTVPRYTAGSLRLGENWRLRSADAAAGDADVPCQLPGLPYGAVMRVEDGLSPGPASVSRRPARL